MNEQNRAGDPGGELPGLADPCAMRNSLVAELRNRASDGNLRSIDPNSLRLSMTHRQQVRYLSVIFKLMAARDLHVVTPGVLFDAADIAIAGEESLIEARIGLLPGTMNPIHHGHVSAALAGILTHSLNGVLLAGGGAPPDKPYSAAFDVRNEMIHIATCEKDIEGWISVTPIRQEAVEMWSGEGRTRGGFGDNYTSTLYALDLAAFIWLFRANPYVHWTYLVGSDKIVDYGRKKERSLVVDVLGDPRANVRLLYYSRLGEHIEVAKDVEPYPWLFEKWQSGFFEKAPLSTCDLSASKIRRAIVEKRTHINGIPLANCVSAEVLRYILRNEALVDSYLRELTESGRIT